MTRPGSAESTDRPGALMLEELRSQPACWTRVLDTPELADGLPAHGEHVAVLGCGSSWFMARSYAAARESAGHGVTDAFTASEFPVERHYDRVVALTRSGTTSEVITALEEIGTATPTVAIVGDPNTPVPELSDRTIVLDFADERSVVQTRFATTALMLLRSTVEPLDTLRHAVREAEEIVAGIDPTTGTVAEQILPSVLREAQQYAFLGRGAAWGLADEAALKLREAAQLWTEAYSSMEYRHGPIAIACPGRVSWQLGTLPDGLAHQVRDTGAHFEHVERDPLAELVRIHALAYTRALTLGLDPDHPRSLTRSVVLTDDHA